MSERTHKRRFCRHPKHKPYGTKGTNPYCSPHDCCMVYSVSKGSERNKARQEIQDELKEIDMVCPKCGNEYHCGCASCAPRHKAAGRICSKPEGDYDTCGHCGLKMHSEEWSDECGRQVLEQEKKEREQNESK